MSAREKTTAAKSPVMTGVRRKNPYSGMLAAKNAATAIHIQMSCLSKKKFSAEKERIVTNPKSDMDRALAKTNQSTWEKILARFSAACLSCEIIHQYCAVRSEGATSGITSSLLGCIANGSGQVNTISELSPASKRRSDVAEAAKALPAGSKMTATNEMSVSATTELFCASAESRGASAMFEISLLLTEIASALFFILSHVKGPVNSKYVCATIRLPALMRASMTGVVAPGMIYMVPSRSATRTF